MLRDGPDREENSSSVQLFAEMTRWPDKLFPAAERPLLERSRLARFGSEMTVKLKLFGAIVVLFSSGLISHGQTEWQNKLKQELPLMGHRNWIVIVDSAYPLQNSTGIETIDTGADHLAVLDYVLAQIKASRHVRPLVHLDKELQFVPESDAPGVEQYRADLKKRLVGFSSDSELHDALIHKLGDAGLSFHVLILKTKMTIPYTSVLLQLDCKYWSADQEARMRDAMKLK
jgi:hypothetical protein